MFLYTLLACYMTPFIAYPSPPGQYINLSKDDIADTAKSISFRHGQPIVGAYFFYWYNIYTKEHFINPDGSDALVDHPADEKDFSYTSVNWWKREMKDITAAGIDFITPVYWGTPGYDSWSFQGIIKMVEAWECLTTAGESPPKIGLFYDTSTLRYNPANMHVDLSTTEGKRWFYHTIRDYYSLIPSKMWAMIEGRPLIFLYSAAFAKKQDPSLFEYVYAAFEKDFACRPYIIKEVSWQGEADADYAWGGAIKPKWHDVVSFGPGYDHHAVPGRKPLVVEREGGKFYESAWEALLAKAPKAPKERPNIVMIETWNELHEGTDVCQTKEYGRQYIELTLRYVNLFKSGKKIDFHGLQF